MSAFETAVRPGELLTQIRIPPAAGHRDAFVAMAAGKESQSIVHVAVSLRIDGTIEAARIALGCVAARPVRASCGRACARRQARRAGGGLGRRERPRRDAIAGRRRERDRRLQARMWRRCWSNGRSSRRQSAGAAAVQPEPRDGSASQLELNGRPHAAEVEARRLLVHFLRTSAAHGDAHRLRHRQLRRLHGDPGRSRGQVLHAPRGAGGRLLAAHGRESHARGRQLSTTPAGIPRGARPAVRVLHPRDADERDLPARAQLRARPTTTSDTRSRATSAAVPAIRTSSARSGWRPRDATR